MPDEPKTPPPIAKSPLLQTEGRPFLVTITAIILVLVNLMLLSDMSFKSEGGSGLYPLVALGMVFAGFAYWAMRKWALLLVGICTIAIAVLGVREGLETTQVLLASLKFAIYLLPGILFWSRMK